MLGWAGMVVSVSEVGRAGGESRRGEGPTQAKRGGGRGGWWWSGAVVRGWKGRIRRRSRNKLEEQSLKKNESCLTPISVANGSATGQTRGAGKQSAVGAVPFPE